MTPDPHDPQVDDDELLDYVLECLEPARAAAIEGRLSEDPALRARLDALRVEQEVLASALGAQLGVEAPLGVEERLVAGLQSARPLPRENTFRWGRRAAVAAGLLIATLLGVRYVQQERGQVEQAQRRMVEKTRISELKALGIEEGS